MLKVFEKFFIDSKVERMRGFVLSRLPKFTLFKNSGFWAAWKVPGLNNSASVMASINSFVKLIEFFKAKSFRSCSEYKWKKIFHLQNTKIYFYSCYIFSLTFRARKFYSILWGDLGWSWEFVKLRSQN